MTTRRHGVKVYIARLGGYGLFLTVLAVGIVVGRVIEAAAVGAVLFAIWTYVGRLVVPPIDSRQGDREWR
jgi:hypothetical protein